MSRADNEALVRRFLEEAYNRGNLAVADELLASNCVFYTPSAIAGMETIKKWGQIRCWYPGMTQTATKIPYIV